LLYWSTNPNKMKKLTKASCALIFLSLILTACRKEISTSVLNKSAETGAGSSGDYIISPAGPVLKSRAHLIETGAHIALRAGHVLKIKDVTGETLEDFGEYKSPAGNNVSPATSSIHLPATNGSKLNLSTGGVPLNFSPRPVKGVSSDWQTWGSMTLSSGYITSLSTTWSVPQTPSQLEDTSYPQVVYIWDGVTAANGNYLMQPVLQWGNNKSFGSYTTWEISNWYVWGTGLKECAYTAPTPVSVNETLTGTVSLNSSNDYVSSFSSGGTVLNTMTIEGGEVINGNTLPAPEQPTIAYETLESYHFDGTGTTQAGDVAEVDDYPAQDYVAMTNITLQASSNTGVPSGWALEPVTPGTFGEHAISANSSVVDLWFKTLPPAFTYSPVNPYPANAAMGVSPVNTGGKATTWALAPGSLALPAGLTLNASTGVISGTPTGASSGTYTILAENPWGDYSNTVTLNIVNSYTFDVETSKANSTSFSLSVYNGSTLLWAAPSPPYTVVGNSGVALTGLYNGVASATIVVQITGGLMPTNALLGASTANSPAVTGVISGNTITFSNFNLTQSQTATIFFDANIK
jgi:hypothetical protein